MTFNDLQFFADRMDVHPFRFARTMPDHPHWYTLRREWEEEADFERCAQIIRDKGVVEYWFSTPYTKLKLGGYKYWTMGSPVEETILINRAKA